MASIFIPDGKPVEEILDRGEARALEIRRAAGTDALEKLQWHLEDVSGAPREHGEHGENVRRPMGAVQRWEAKVRPTNVLTAEHCQLLYDYRLAVADPNLTNARGQRERVVEVHAVGLLGSPRVVPHHLAEDPGRHRYAGYRDRVDLQAADAITGIQHAARQDEQASRKIAERIQPPLRTLLARLIQVDVGRPSTRPSPSMAIWASVTLAGISARP